MEIVITLEPWPDDSPVSHDSTKFYIKDPDKNIVAEDTITGLLYIKEIDIPIGETYYVVAERQFSLKDLEYDISNINYLSDEYAVTNNEGEISNMLLSKPVIIEQPVIFFNKKDMIDSNDYINIKSSSYRGSGDGHTHTHWVLIADKEIVFTSLKDNINKTSINIDKSILKNKSKLEIVCIHCSNNIESMIARLNIRFNSLNFVLSSKLTNIPLTNYEITIDKLDNTKKMRLTKVNISHDKELLKSYLISTDRDTLNIYIQSSLIESGRYLNIDLYGYDDNATLGKKSYILQPIDISYEDNINKDYVYKNKYTNNIVDNLLPLGLVTDNIGDNIYVPTYSGFNICNVTENGDFTVLKYIPGLSHLGKKDNLFIKYNNDNTVLIDCLDTNDNPTFMVYQHDIVLDTYIFKHMISRDDEISTMAELNSIEQIDKDNFIYSVNGSNELKIYNKSNNSITNLKPIPLTNVNSSTIIKMDDNNLLVIPNKDHQTFIYNIKKNEYTNAMSIPYQELIGKEIKKIDLVNGDKILITNNNTEDSKLGYFAIKNYELSLVENKVSSKGILSLYKRYNDIYIGNILTKDYVTYDYDRMNVVVFQ